MCSNKRNNYFKVFEKFIKFLDDNNKFLKKICGDCHTSLGLRLIRIFSNNEKLMNSVSDFMDNHSTKLELGEHGYINLSNLEGLNKDDLATWFSRFILGNGKTVGKGEVLLSILFNNVYKTPLTENENGEPGDLFLSDNGKTPIGRIEVKSALPGGFMFEDKIRFNDLEKLSGSQRLIDGYKHYLESLIGTFAMDKDLFIELCVYCIAKYMHSQYPNEKNYYFLIFDNQPRINSKGNIHDTMSRKIKKIIDYDGSVDSVKENVFMDDEDDDWGFHTLNMGDEDNEWDFTTPEETILSDRPDESENGNEDIKIKDIEGFLYIKRCKTIEETMNRIMSFVDKESSVYKENKSNKRNNFTFYVKNKKICIAHRDNPSLVSKNENK